MEISADVAQTPVVGLANNDKDKYHSSSCEDTTRSEPQTGQHIGRLGKACESCRVLKVACRLDPNSTNRACQRCVKAQRECIRLPLSVPKRHSLNNNTRLKGLEDKVNSFLRVLDSTRSFNSRGSLNDAPLGFTSVDYDKIDANTSHVIDVIKNGTIDEVLAYELFNFYRSDMSNTLPFVVFPAEVTAEAIRLEKPLLFLSIISVATGVIKTEVHQYLTTQVWKILADRVINNGTPSLEVIQSLLVMAVFYTHHEQRSDHKNYHHLVHSAATMAMDAGMGRRAHQHRKKLFRDPWEQSSIANMLDSTEVRRTWLGIYYLCSTIATTLKRPHLIRWNTYNQECLDILSVAQDAVISDIWLCNLVQAEHIIEEVHFQFSMDDPQVSVPFFNSTTTIHLNLFERRLQEWSGIAASILPEVILVLIQSYSNIYIHEPALHDEHDIDNFKPPFAMQPEDDEPEQTLSFKVNRHIPSILLCQQAVHQMIRIFTTLDKITIRCLPCVVFVRLLYASIVLLKLGCIMLSDERGLLLLVTLEGLDIEKSLDGVIQALAQASESGRNRYVGEFWEQIKLMKLWWEKKKQTFITITTLENIYQASYKPPATSGVATQVNIVDDFMTTGTQPIFNDFDLLMQLEDELNWPMPA